MVVPGLGRDLGQGQEVVFYRLGLHHGPDALLEHRVPILVGEGHIGGEVLERIPKPEQPQQLHPVVPGVKGAC